MGIKESNFTVCKVSQQEDPYETQNSIQKSNSQNRDVIAELLDKIGGLKSLKEYESIIEGAKAGMTAYQKPQGGIPLTDLSKDLQVFVLNVTSVIDAIQNGLSQDCGIVDTQLNINSNNAIANSEVTRNFDRIEKTIPSLDVDGEKLKFE